MPKLILYFIYHYLKQLIKKRKYKKHFIIGYKMKTNLRLKKFQIKIVKIILLNRKNILLNQKIYKNCLRI